MHRCLIEFSSDWDEETTKKILGLVVDRAEGLRAKVTRKEFVLDQALVLRQRRDAAKRPRIPQPADSSRGAGCDWDPLG
ncbi:MAG: hypothetical protein A2735_02195 [Candidatus Yanofskybacteria bacterium RIFCSPHIGHO2_01_FULL_41_21]|uniref:Uncharacterized protein n=1 Tax=Candidatus Yanofskybacteria bacterium RIFCSPHIGHO2_01_FULL_41_21 TaxID=1802660 RepID=A0A1F8E9F0_9BACT|nr:MAG: hypothetical protein A2735_02195 [Candidatus Yanofskybacteria bacterium RIFCSPHIGHO2_01_FULL_41_21]